MLYFANFLRRIRYMREETNRIDESHRKELLKFLLVKTAAVRQGIKPAELLRVRHYYSGVDDTNEADQTDSKIAAWVETLKAAL